MMKWERGRNEKKQNEEIKTRKMGWIRQKKKIEEQKR